ncbi:hypothetical protein KZZ20_10965 [Methylacidiphilum fumariolicum]|uniref:Uncharacterized protein n=2 Tax=Candidatus Methylacidiphilum fumarolicum TaxID=591154 RepID=I0JYI1_METFB|nr:hypothetical protein [Candidatus Methylacidiphilum fumarolicum]MBW6416024.1 hypothetical protein [Candidatus Methylacidiphilum fumarolicum]CAI9084853.1 conserved protein of unknown function [Candidatus Methylacidiphilum fumarolicum]CCG92300.1 hypothetical protein MFUM_580006 [Methylacidiphilum fumariolicum SolV]
MNSHTKGLKRLLDAVIGDKIGQLIIPPQGLAVVLWYGSGVRHLRGKKRGSDPYQPRGGDDFLGRFDQGRPGNYHGVLCSAIRESLFKEN